MSSNEIQDIDTIGERIRRYRITLDFTQREIGRAISRSPQWVGFIENGMVVPSDRDVHRIADALGISPAVLFNKSKPAKRRRLEHL